MLTPRRVLEHARDAIAKRLPRKVVILGRSDVGKSALRDALLADPRALGSSTYTSRVFSTVSSRGRPRYFVVEEIHAANMGFANWKKAYSRAHCVLYVFRADLVAFRDAKHVGEVRTDIGRLKSWKDDKGIREPDVILIGTWADIDERYSADTDGFTVVVAESTPIKTGLVMLDAELVVGELATRTGAITLADHITNRIS